MQFHLGILLRLEYVTKVRVKWLLVPDKNEDDPQRKEASVCELPRMVGQFNHLLPCMDLKQWTYEQCDLAEVLRFVLDQDLFQILQMRSMLYASVGKEPTTY